MNLLDIPSEVLIYIISELPLKDIVSIEISCAALHRQVINSTELQYCKELRATQLLSSHSAHSNIPFPDRIARLRQLEDAWHMLALGETYNFCVERRLDADGDPQLTLCTLSGDALIRIFLEDGCKTTLSWCTLPVDSASFGEEPLDLGSFSICDSPWDSELTTWIVDFPESLVVVLGSDSQSDVLARDIVHFLDFRKGAPHHSAHQASLLLSHGLKHHLAAMNGDTVVISICSQTSHVAQNFLLYHWKSGHSELLFPSNYGHHLDQAQFLTPSTLLLIHDDNLAIEAVIVGVTAHQRVVFQLPCVVSNDEFLKKVMYVHFRPNSIQREPLQGSNHEEGIIVLFMHIQLDERIYSQRIHSPFSNVIVQVDLIISKSKILNLVRFHAPRPSRTVSGPCVVTWSAWGRQCTRLIDRPSIRGDQWVYGSRLMSRFNLNSTISDKVEVLDFNPYARRHYGTKNHLLDPTGDLMEAVFVDSPSPSSHSHFRGDIATELPYWRVVRKGMQDWGYSDFLFNDSLILTNLNDRDCLPQLRFLEDGTDG